MELNRGNGETENVPKNRHFFCRMNVSRNARRQMRFGDQKVCIRLNDITIDLILTLLKDTTLSLTITKNVVPFDF